MFHKDQWVSHGNLNHLSVRLNLLSVEGRQRGLVDRGAGRVIWKPQIVRTIRRFF